MDRPEPPEISERLQYLVRFLVCSSSEIQDSIASNSPIQEDGALVGPPGERAGSGFAYSREHRGDAEQRESGRARARRTSPGHGAPSVHYHRAPPTRGWLRAILKGGMSHGLDRLLGRRGRHHCLRAEDDGRLLGSGPVKSVPDSQAWTIRVGPRRGRRTLAENQQPPGSAEGKHRGESGGVRAAPQGSPGHEGVVGPDVVRHGLGRAAQAPGFSFTNAC